VTDELRVHLHFTMRGTFPLRLLDILFGTERLHYVEYGYLTPVDLAIGSATRRARAFAQQVTDEGVAGALDHADSVETRAYDSVEAIEVFDGSRLTRPKVIVRDANGPTTVRVHGEFDADAFAGALESTLDAHDVVVRRREGGLRGLLGR
jgi:hypothetical protein